MKVLLGLACVLATSGAVAQTTTTTTTVETTKSVRMDLGKPYANLSLRHYNATFFNDQKTEEVENTDAFVQGRAYLGSKWVNDKVDTYLRLIYTVEAGNTVVQSKNPRLTVNVTAYKGQLGAVNTYLHYAPTLGSDAASEGNFGAMYSLPNIDLGSGFAINGALDTWGTWYGGDAKNSRADVFVSKDSKNKTKAKNKATGSDLQVDKSDPNVDFEASLALGYTVPTLSDLSFSLGTLYHVDYDARYTQESSGRINSEYQDSAYTESHFLVGYKFTDALKLDNTFYYYNEDFYGDAFTKSKDNRYLNRVRLSYKLF